MRPDVINFRSTHALGFTLVEMIGALAIAGILASVLVPNALRSMDRAAVTAEAQTLANLGDQVKLYLSAQGTAPTSANWTTALGGFADLSPADLATNKRNITRVYLTDPAANPTPRVIILSGMRAGLALPTSANINNAVRFQDIWQTADGSVPTTVSWAGWSGWSAVANSGNYLVIERVNLSSVYNTDLQSLTITLNNRGAATASYNLVLADGTSQAAVNISAGTSAILSGQRPKIRFNLYRAASGATLDYSYVLSTTGKTFDFNGTNWIPQ
jgi:prepilin-type N-terminal cleavage/methylation domain-containing protein